MKSFEMWASEPPYELSLDTREYNPWPGHYSDYPVQLASEAWNEATAQMQVIIDAQAKEIEALRGFAQSMRKYYDHPKSLAIEYGLIDESGNPTKLLTGGKA